MWSVILVSSAVVSLVAVAVAIVPDDPAEPTSSPGRPRRRATRAG